MPAPQMYWMEQFLMWPSQHERHTQHGQWPGHSGRGWGGGADEPHLATGASALCPPSVGSGRGALGLAKRGDHLKCASCPSARSRSTEAREAALGLGQRVQPPGFYLQLDMHPWASMAPSGLWASSVK